MKGEEPHELRISPSGGCGIILYDVFRSVCFSAATWVGGTFIIGTAETVYDPEQGLIWAVMPLAATLAFTLGKTVSIQNNNFFSFLFFF